MAFYTYRDISLTLNNKALFANDITVSQSNDLSNPFIHGEKSNERSISNKDVETVIDFSYYLTGKDFIKDYIDQNKNFVLSGNLNGINWNEGYLRSYSINGKPNSPLIVNASIIVADSLTGTFNASNPSQPPENLKIINFNDCQFVSNAWSVVSPSNIIDYTWNFTSEIEPIYFQKDTGVENSNADRVYVGKKEITSDIVSESENFNLDFSGQNFAIDLRAKSPTSPEVYETFGVSGKLNQKTWGIADGDYSRMTFSISQSHTNNIPSISSVDTSNFNGTGYLLIDSPDFENGYFSPNKELNLIEKINLGDRECDFIVDRGGSYDTITVYVPKDGINGFLDIQTSKGTIFYPTKLNLNWPEITVSGFTPETGRQGNLITITGLNFWRASEIQFGNSKTTSFYQSSGNSNAPVSGMHILTSYLPSNANVGEIRIVASRRGRSGISSDVFYPEPLIESFSPTTGIWSGVLNVTGKNFSGIQEVLINEVPMTSYVVVNNYLITGEIPGTGDGYTKGQIKITGQDGMVEWSDRVYRPVVPIYDISAISGTAEEDFAIYTVVDTGFLYPYPDGSGGFQVFFGRNTQWQSGVYGRFFESGGGVMTGLIPQDVSNGKIAFVEPNGISLYPPYTGGFSEIGPAPIIDRVLPKHQDYLGDFQGYIKRYTNNSIDLYGHNMKDFFGLDWYAMLSGTGNVQTYSDMNVSHIVGVNSTFYKVSFTGFITGHTGYYDVYLRNYVGTGYLKTGLWVDEAEDLTQFGTASQFYEETSSINRMQPLINETQGGHGVNPSSYAIDGNDKTFSFPYQIKQDEAHGWSFTFDEIQNVSFLKIRTVSPDWTTDQYFRKGEGLYTKAGGAGYGYPDPVRYGCSVWSTAHPNLWPYEHEYHLRKMTTGKVIMYDLGGEVMWEWLNGDSGEMLDITISNSDTSYLGTGIKQITISGNNDWFDYTKGIYGNVLDTAFGDDPNLGGGGGTYSQALTIHTFGVF